MNGGRSKGTEIDQILGWKDRTSIESSSSGGATGCVAAQRNKQATPATKTTWNVSVGTSKQLPINIRHAKSSIFNSPAVGRICPTHPLLVRLYCLFWLRREHHFITSLHFANPISPGATRLYLTTSSSHVATPDVSTVVVPFRDTRIELSVGRKAQLVCHRHRSARTPLDWTR